MEFDDKTLALAKHLKCDPALIENNYSDYFTVNGRTVKEGKTPEDYKKLAQDFRALLSDEMAELVTDAIVNPTKKVTIKKAENEVLIVSLPDHAYATVSAYLEPMQEKAKKRVEQLARINAGTWKPPIKETPEDIYTRLQQDNLYVVNVLYYLVKADREDYNSDHVNSIRRAWLGQPVSDTRRDQQVDDGEYLVSTDDEADEWEEEGLRQLFDDMVPREVRDSFIGRYIDADKFVEEQSGNRGENINGYDGTEEEVEFEGTTYYIYRNN